jgi:transketolase
MTHHQSLANCIRFLSVDAVEKAQSGHPGLPLGMADVMTVLYREFLKFNPNDPLWPNRDRFVLSAGHGSMLLYAVLYLTGYQKMTLAELKKFRKLHALTAGHPEHDPESGIETTTGPLGQGFANAVGMALSERTLAQQYPGLVDHYTYVLVGDGCLMEGISYEAMSFAGHQKLGKLIVLFDDNGITIDGSTHLAITINHQMYFESMGWHVQKINGHDPKAIHDALENAQKETKKPSIIICKTIIGYGAPTKSNSEKAHGSPLGSQEILGLRQHFDWPYDPFEIPDLLKEAWLSFANRSRPLYESWQDMFSLLPKSDQEAFLKRQDIEVYFEENQNFPEVQEILSEKKPLATRACSEIVLKDLLSAVPELLGGSADLSGSNNTKVQGMQVIQSSTPNGNYIHYGIREHAMAGIMNGIALHGGFIPYGGTFLAFSDYCRPSIRLSALMGCQVIYVMTHDSIGLGEDGPTHQPIEHLMSLRLIPNLLVFRPADLMETLEAWQCALTEKNRPSILVLSRQKLPQLNAWRSENKTKKGAYILHKNDSVTEFCLIATGSEVSLAAEVYALLTQQGISGSLVSMPCTNYFLSLPANEKKEIIGDASVLKIVIEAGSTQGWASLLESSHLLTFGLNAFGASAPGPDVYGYFGLTASNISKKIMTILEDKEK